MVDEPDTPRDLPWRKRHPVASRLILYALGVGLAVLLVVLLLEREQQDEQDRVEALATELDNLGLVHALDADGTQVLRLLDEKFSDPALPPKVRGRVLRWRALALRKRGDHAAVEQVLESAAALELPDAERVALQLEWAEARLDAGDGAGALAALPPMSAVRGEAVFGLFRALLFAQAKNQEGKRTAGLADLREAMAALEAPLDAHDARYVGGDEWSVTQVATVVTQVLAKEGAASRAPHAWRRLLRLAPRDYEALLACTHGFLALGLEEDARAAWVRVRALDPAKAAAQAARDPALAGLSDDR